MPLQHEKFKNKQAPKWASDHHLMPPSGRSGSPHRGDLDAPFQPHFTVLLGCIQPHFTVVLGCIQPHTGIERAETDTGGCEDAQRGTERRMEPMVQRG